MSYLDARGSVISVISWIAIILTVLIAVFWYANNFNLSKIALEKAENDLSNIRKMVDEACELDYYRAEYNPATEEGKLHISDANICIKTSEIHRCKSTICTMLAYTQPKAIDLSEITNVIVTKDAGGISID